jgi:hypothetical protein
MQRRMNFLRASRLGLWWGPRQEGPGTPGEQVKILREALVKTFNDPSFHQEYKKLTGDEATPLMPGDMEKAIKELPRDGEIVELFKKIAGGGPLPPR